MWVGINKQEKRLTPTTLYACNSYSKYLIYRGLNTYHVVQHIEIKYVTFRVFSCQQAGFIGSSADFVVPFQSSVQVFILSIPVMCSTRIRGRITGRFTTSDIFYIYPIGKKRRRRITYVTGAKM